MTVSSDCHLSRQIERRASILIVNLDVETLEAELSAWGVMTYLR